MFDHIQHGGFSSKAYIKNKRKHTLRNFTRQYGRRNSYHKAASSSMLAKMGICALIVGFVLLFENTDSPVIAEVSSGFTSNQTDQDIGGDYLGKLRFVELPGIIQVFSSDAKLKIDAEYCEYKLGEDNLILTISEISSKNFSAPADGTIKALTKLDDKTKIDLSIDGDIVLSFTAMGEPTVEEGQPVKNGDTLYGAIDSLDISVTKGGRPVNPAEYFDIRNTLLS